MHNEQLKSLHDKRREKTRELVDAAIKDLIRHETPINFNSVAKTSGLSKTTLYNNPDIKDRINSFRITREIAGQNTLAKRSLSKTSKDAVIESLKRKRKRLIISLREIQILQINITDLDLTGYTTCWNHIFIK